MESIKFYQGQEDVVVIEETDFGQSIFREQYTQALLQLEKIVAKPKDSVPSIVAFCGDRGEGKSSCMETILKMMGNMEAPAINTFMEETVVQHDGKKTNYTPIVMPPFTESEV